MVQEFRHPARALLNRIANGFEVGPRSLQLIGEMQSSKDRNPRGVRKPGARGNARHQLVDFERQVFHLAGIAVGEDREVLSVNGNAD